MYLYKYGIINLFRLKLDDVMAEAGARTDVDSNGRHRHARSEHNSLHHAR